AAVETLVDEAGAAAGDVHQLADQVGIHPLREVVQVQVQVVDAAAELGSEVVAQVLRIEVFQVGTGHDEGATRLGHLLAVDGQETVDVDPARGAETGAVQDGRPEQAVEADDVLADEVH